MPPISLSVAVLYRDQPYRRMAIYRKYFSLDTLSGQMAKMAVSPALRAGDRGEKLSHHIDMKHY